MGQILQKWFQVHFHGDKFFYFVNESKVLLQKNYLPGDVRVRKCKVLPAFSKSHTRGHTKNWTSTQLCL